VTAVLTEVELGDQVAVRGAPQPGFPLEPNTTAAARGRLVLRLGPDEWLVLGGREADYPGAAAAVDLSASRVAFDLAGAGAAALLAQGCSLDLEALAPGACAQTLLARAEVVLVRLEPERFRLLVRPSFAGHVRAWLERHGARS
jgi:sarcosine oxidase subunit gamma